MPAVSQSSWPQLLIALFAVLLGTLAIERAHAQVNQGEVPSPFNLSDEALRDLVKQYTDPLHDRLRIEIAFLAKVCELNDEQVALLKAAGRAAIERTGEKLVLALRQDKPGQRAQKLVVIKGQGVAVPADFIQEAVSPDRAVRRELTRALQDTWPEAWDKFNAEQRRLDAFRKQAGARAKVSEMDEALVLSGEQRTELCKQFINRTSDTWWQTAKPSLPIDPISTLYISVAGDRLGAFMLQADEWQTMLRAPQVSAYQELQLPRKEEMVVAQQAAAGPPVPAAQPPGARALAAGQRMVAQPAIQRLQLRIVRRGPRMEDQQRQLAAYLERSLDEIQAVCDLTQAQREKLLLAGKLDLVRWQAELPPPDKLAEGEKVVVQRVQVAPGQSRLPLEVFSSEGAYFRKALCGRLLGEQKQRLATAERERREFHRQALVDAVVVGFERVAALTSRQCGELSLALNDALAPDNQSGSNEWRVKALRSIAQLPEDRFRPLFWHFQLTAVHEQQAQLALIARQLEAQQVTQAVRVPAAAGGGMF